MSLAHSSRTDHQPSTCSVATKVLLLFLAAALAGCAREKTVVCTQEIAPAQSAPPPAAVKPAVIPMDHAEQVRKNCIAGRRLICGKVLKVFPDGLVVDSGYTDLLRPPLTESWIVPGTVPAHRDANILELNEPGTPCIGLAFLTDIPRRQKVKQFDYVILMGYPAGEYVYTPAPNVKKTIRKFAAGLDTAVRLSIQAESKPTSQ
jgi:hypothetical protein